MPLAGHSATFALQIYVHDTGRAPPPASSAMRWRVWKPASSRPRPSLALARPIMRLLDVAEWWPDEQRHTRRNTSGRWTCGRPRERAHG